MKQRFLIVSALSAIIVSTTMLALVFFCAAGYFYLAPLYGQVNAALIVAVAALTTSTVLGAITVLMAHNAKERLKESLKFSTLSALAPAAITTLTRRFGGLGAIAAMAFGYWATSRKAPRAR